MKLKPITHVLGIDQAGKSGWALARLGDGAFVLHGLARNPKERSAVLREVVRVAGSLEHVLVVMEDHTQFKLTRLTRFDYRTKRTTAKRAGAPERGMKQIIGMGDARGRWREKLEDAGHPVMLRDDVDARVWRARLGIRGRGTVQLKAEAVRWCATRVSPAPRDHNIAEGCCLTAYGVLDGLDRLALRVAKQEAQRRVWNARRRQLALTADEPELEEDEDGEDDE